VSVVVIEAPVVSRYLSGCKKISSIPEGDIFLLLKQPVVPVLRKNICSSLLADLVGYHLGKGNSGKFCSGLSSLNSLTFL
jgi:hypothetical protein